MLQPNDKIVIRFAIWRRGRYISTITARRWLLSVTESVVLPSHPKKGGQHAW